MTLRGPLVPVNDDVPADGLLVDEVELLIELAAVPIVPGDPGKLCGDPVVIVGVTIGLMLDGTAGEVSVALAKPPPFPTVVALVAGLGLHGPAGAGWTVGDGFVCVCIGAASAADEHAAMAQLNIAILIGQTPLRFRGG